jgi:hypothetical protein
MLLPTIASTGSGGSVVRGAERHISELAPDIIIRDFDLSRDGSVILFDRIADCAD